MTDPLANALIFIPDISGFTQFVKGTDLSHSQHIIEELLEELLDANTIGLELSEIEGDAILFYKELDDTLNLSEIIGQITEMFQRFHSHLKVYEHQRICQCGACSTAHELQLKFIVHNGPVSFNLIKGHKKLFGEHVITAHRLLKNNIPATEYALFTDTFLNGFDKEDSKVILENELCKPIALNSKYDIGDISYQYCDLNSLVHNIPDPAIEKYQLKGDYGLVDVSTHTLNVPLELYFNVLTDYSLRHKWSSLIKDSTELNGFMVRDGSTHRCLIKNDETDPFFKAHDFKLEADEVIFQESDESKGFNTVYQLRRDSNATVLTVSNYVKGGWIKKFLLKVLFKRKLIASKKETFRNIEEYCLQLINSGNQPKHQIVLAVSE